MQRQYMIFMVKKHFQIVILTLALGLMLSACGKEKTEEQINIENEEEIGVFSDEEIKASEEGETGEETVEVLSEADCKALVDEKLSDGLEAEFYGNVASGDETFLIFSVNKNGETLKQLLAVNDETGEVLLYDDLKSEFLPFSEFEYYNPAKDSDTDWNGQYLNESFTLSIEATDPGNFEYRIMKGKKEIYQGFAFYNDYISAQSQTEEYGKVLLSLDEKTISIKADKECEFAGTYTKQ